jgi:hypothetical protein
MGGGCGNCMVAVAAKKNKSPRGSRLAGFEKYCRQRPTLPYSFPYSTIGGSRLNFRVRNGNGCDPAPMTTGIGLGRPRSLRYLLASWGFQGPQRASDRSILDRRIERRAVASTNAAWGLARRIAAHKPRLDGARVVPDNLVKELNTLQTVVSRDQYTQRLCCIKNYGQASRRISIGQLNVSPRLHLRPINLVIFQEPSGILRSREISSCGGFHA